MIIGKTRLTNFYIFLPSSINYASRNTVLYSLGFLDFVLYYARSHWLCTYQCQARGGGGGGSGNPRKFDGDAYPQGGDFDLTSCI